MLKIDTRSRDSERLGKIDAFPSLDGTLERGVSVSRPCARLKAR